jgi:hypothetical protein
MKTGIITAAIAALALVGTATQGEARPHRKHCNSKQVYVSGYRSCGTPVYQTRYVSPYQRCGTPYWNTRYMAPRRVHYYQPPVCPPPVRYCPPPVQVCPPTYYHGGYPRNGVVIQGSFRL